MFMIIFILTIEQLCSSITLFKFVYFFLPSLHDYDVKVPLISRFLEDVSTRKRLPLSFSEFGNSV